MGWVVVTAAMALVLFLFVVYFNYRKDNMEELDQQEHHKDLIADDHKDKP